MKFLVCEPDRTTAEPIRRELVRAGHEVAEAHEEAEALRPVRTEYADFVILDWTGIGPAPLRALRDRPWTAEVPVFVLTAGSTDEAICEAYHQGADMVLTKPFNPRELVPFSRRD